MPNTASGLDTAWQFPSEAALRAWADAHRPNPVVSLYLSYDPSKNATPARIRLLHHLGVGVLLNFEHNATRALEGRGAGVADGQTSAHLIRALEAAVRYQPLSRLIVPFSVDFDATPGQFPAIDAYLGGAQDGLAGIADEGDYGSYSVVMHTAAAGVSHMEWQTYAWSRGNFAAGVADFYQWRNSQKVGGADVDFDQVIDAARLGAWWPPGHPLNRPAGPSATSRPTPEPPPEDHMILVQVDPTTVPAHAARPGIFTYNGSALRHVEPPTGKVSNLNGLVGKLGHPVMISYRQYQAWGGK